MTSVQVRKWLSWCPEDPQVALEMYFSGHERGHVKCQSGFLEGGYYKVPVGPSTTAAIPSEFFSARSS